MKRLILLSLILWSQVMGQIGVTQPSVAVIDDPYATKINPAGLGFTNHEEVSIFGLYDGSELTKDFALYNQGGHSGSGYEWNSVTGENIWTTAFGFSINDLHTMGFSYSFANSDWKGGNLNIGWMHRPTNFLSLGATLANAWSGSNPFQTLTTGIAIQNPTGRFGFSIDGAFDFDNPATTDDVDSRLYAGVFFEPVKGIRINGFSDIGEDSPAIGLSISVFTSNFGLESHGKSQGSSSNTFGLRFSNNAYRTIFKDGIKKSDSETWVRMKLHGYFIEEPEFEKPPFDFDFNIPLFGGNQVYGRQLKKFIDDMADLAADPAIDGLIIDMGYVRGGFTKIVEIRDALQGVKDSGKKIIVYSKTGLSNVDVFITSMADEIYTHNMGSVDLRGLNIEMTFFRGLLDTLSIVPEVWRISPYKTAGDAFLNRGISDEMHSNYSQLFGSIYDEFIKGITEGKGWTTEKTIETVNNGPYFLSERAIEAELLTGTKYPDEFEEYIEELNDSKNKILSFSDYLDDDEYVYEWKKGGNRDKIAVIYAVGGIQTGKSRHSPQGSSVMGDETIAKAIKQAREDKDIKAIVLRIDSGGGSALASDVMWREALKTTKLDSANVKPFIASMSSVAASGGYYIACQADTIMAAPATITGSIGVIGMRLNFSQLQERFGINTDIIKMGERADFASGSRLASEEESEMIMSSIQDIYIKFKERVVSGRESITDIDDLDEIALGRVWTGTDAVDNGLIDLTGGYYDAIDVAKAAAGIEGEVEIVEFPKRKKVSGLADMLNNESRLSFLPEELQESLEIIEMIDILENDQNQMILPVRIEIK